MASSFEDTLHGLLARSLLSGLHPSETLRLSVRVCASEYCKCRGCSLCKPCSSTIEGDLRYEGCEDWCSVPEHCSHCKCKACSICKACTPHSPDDTNYEDAQPWCLEKAHCEFCKCKGAPRCKSVCTPFNGDDDDFTSCQGWCKGSQGHCVRG